MFSAAQARARHYYTPLHCLLAPTTHTASRRPRRTPRTSTWLGSNPNPSPNPNQDPENEYLRLTLRPAWQALQTMRVRTAREWSELLQMDAAP